MMPTRLRGLWSAALRHRANVVTLVSGGVLSLLAIAIGTRLQTQFMSPETFGEVKLAHGVSALALGLVLRPMIQFGMREYHDARVSGRELAFERFAREQQARLGWLVAGFVLVVLLALPMLGVPIGPLAALAMAATVLLEVGISGGASFLLTQNRQKLATLIDVVRQWGLMAAGVLAVLLVRDGAFEVLAAQAVLTLGIWATLRLRQTSGAPTAITTPERETWSHRLRGFVLPLLASNLFGWVSGLGDRYFLAAFSSPAEVGRYAAVYGLASTPMIAAGAIAQRAFLPFVFGGAASDDGSRGRRAMGQLLLLNALIAVAATLFMLLFGPLAIDLLLGPRFREGSMPIFRWLVIAHALFIFWIALETLFQAEKRTRPLAAAQMLGALLTVVANALLVPRYGGLGAALATLAAYTSQVLLGVVLAFGRRAQPA